MAQEIINVSTANDGLGDTVRAGGVKINNNFTELYTALTGKQPLDSDLTAIAALTTTSYGRSLLTQADAAALRTLAGLVIGTNVQAYSAALALYAAISPSGNVQSLLGAADYAAMRALLGTSYTIAKSGVAASITGTLTETTLGTFSIPAGAMGPNGQIEITSLWQSTSSANNKTFKVNFGASTAWTATVTTTSAEQAYTRVANRNATNSQVVWINAGGYGSGTNASVVTFAVNSASAVTVNLTGTLANTGETITLESWIARVTYGA